MLISEVLKAAIRDSGQSLGEIARGSGVARPILSRFVNDDPISHRDIRLEITADRLAEYFGLELVPKKRGK